MPRCHAHGLAARTEELGHIEQAENAEDAETRSQHGAAYAMHPVHEMGAGVRGAFF